jgi:hypothetical protein
MKMNRSTGFARMALWLALVLASLQFCLAPQCHAGGVTLITHGYDSDVTGWITAMADEIPAYFYYQYGGWSSNISIYTVTLISDGTTITNSCQPDSGSSPLETDTGEIIVKLDWSQMAGGLDEPYDYSTYVVAKAAADFLLQDSGIPELNGHPVVEYPIHLIGHSRGGSLMNEISYILGTNGIWVDHLTTLDPHPLNADGNEDSHLFPTDASASNTWATVLFHDNYWQDIGVFTDPDGETVFGAYNRQLTELSGGYNDTDLTTQSLT